MRKARLEEFVDEMDDFVRKYPAIWELNSKSDFGFLLASSEDGVLYYDLDALYTIADKEDPRSYAERLSLTEFLVGSDSEEAKELAIAKANAIAAKAVQKYVSDYTYSREVFMMSLAMNSSLDDLRADIRQFVEEDVKREIGYEKRDEIYDAIVEVGKEAYLDRKVKALMEDVEKATVDLKNELEDKPAEEKRILKKSVKTLEALKTDLTEFKFDEQEEIDIPLSTSDVFEAVDIEELIDIDTIVSKVIEEGSKYSYTIEDFVEFVVAHNATVDGYLSEKDVEAVTKRLITITKVWSKMVNFKGIPYSEKTVTAYVRYLKNADYMYGDMVPLFDVETCMSDDERADIEARRLTILEAKKKKRNLTFPKQRKDEV